MNTLVPIHNNKLPQAQITTRKLAEELIKVFNNCVGLEKAITRDKLFLRLFNKPYNQNNLVDYIRYDFIKKATHYLRTHSNCFVICKNDYTDVKFFVISNEEEANYYINTLNNSIKRMKVMQKKALTSVKQRWYNHKFEIRNGLLLK